MLTGSFRLADLSVSAKVLLTAFLVLVGVGYLVGTRNMYERHQDADLEPGLTFADLRRVFHGLDKKVTSETRRRLAAPMEKMTTPGGPMRKHLEKGGERSVRVLTSWLENDGQEAEFTRSSMDRPGDPSPQQVIADLCIVCHNATDGKMKELPYAASVTAEPEYALVAEVAVPRYGPTVSKTTTMHLAPTDASKLVHVTHAHIMAIPVFTLIIGALFLLTGLPEKYKTFLGPLPTVVLCADFSSWWLARTFEPFVYVIGAAGVLYGIGFGFQIFCVLGSLWFGKGRERPSVP